MTNSTSTALLDGLRSGAPLVDERVAEGRGSAGAHQRVYGTLACTIWLNTAMDVGMEVRGVHQATGVLVRIARVNLLT